MSKKHNFISLSTTETEYIAAGSYCTQLLWMQKLLHDYGIRQEHLTIYYDNTSAINICKNLVQPSRTKHIEIRHHFIRELSNMVLLLLSLFTLMIRRLICLPNLFTANGLNSFAKTLVSSPWIDLFFSSSFLMHLHLVLCIDLSYLTCFCLVVFQFCFILLFIKIKIKIEKYKNNVCLCTLVLVYLGWPLKQSFLNFVFFVA